MHVLLGKIHRYGMGSRPISLMAGLEIVAIKRYLNRKKAVATVESAAEPVAAGPANAE